MTLRLLAVGEGPADIGRDATQSHLEEPGVVTTLVERRLPDGQVVDWTRMATKDRRLKTRGRHRRVGKLSPMASKVLRALLIAEEAGHDGIVFHSDALRGTTLTELSEGRAAAEASGLTTPCALAVPHPEIEAWLVADVETLERVLDTSVQGQLRRRCLDVAKRPQAKELWKEALGGAGRDGEAAELRSEVARELRPEVLCERCPEGFPVFWEGVGGLGR